VSNTLHPNVKALTWFNFTVDFTLYAPVAILYFSRVTGSYELGLSVFSVEMVSSSIFELPTGILSDFVGRRKTVVFGAISALVAGVFYALGFNYWYLFVGSIFAGLARSFYSGNNDALLHESLQEFNQEDEYAKYAGRADSSFQIALATSALLGGLIASWSFALLMWLSVIPRLVGVFISLRLIEPKTAKEKGEANIYNHFKEAVINFKNNWELRSLGFASILSYGIGETLYQFQAAFIATLWPIWAIGFAKTASNVFAATGIRISALISKKIGFIRTLLVGSVYSRVINLMALIKPTIISPALMCTTSLAAGIGWIAEGSLFQKHFTNKQRATMGSLNSLASSLFFGLFALAFGHIADKLNPSRAMIVGEILLFSVIIIYLNIYRRSEKP
jgi:MFS family permease